MMVINSNNKFSFKGLVRTCSSVFPGRLAAPSWCHPSQGGVCWNIYFRARWEIMLQVAPWDRLHICHMVPSRPIQQCQHWEGETLFILVTIIISSYRHIIISSLTGIPEPALPQLPLTLLQLCTTSLTPCHPTSETKNLSNLQNQ